MVLHGLIGFLGGAWMPLVAGLIVWLSLRNCNPETRRKRAQILLVLAPFVVATLLFVGYLIFQ